MSRNPNYKAVQAWIDEADLATVDHQLNQLGINRTSLFAGFVRHLATIDVNVCRNQKHLKTILGHANDIDQERRKR